MGLLGRLEVMPPSDEKRPGIFVPGRFIPTPHTISPVAQACLSNPPPIVVADEPDPKDKAAWRAHVDERNRQLTALLSANTEAHPGEVTAHDLSSARLYEIKPASLSPEHEQRAVLYIHGGAFIVGGGYAAAYAAMSIASLTRTRTFSVDYRMPPDHPFPAGLDDAVEAYRLLLARYAPASIAVYGPSAGGCLAAACILKARDGGLPMPAACVLHSPQADLTESGDTFETNAQMDTVLRRLTHTIALYADGHDLRDPYLSPLFADFGGGFPPTLLSSGTRDLFLSNTVLLHRALRRAGIQAELHVFEAMSHAGFFGKAPEDRELLAEHARFIDERLRGT
jgi:monoterpene epsilon-lactone hydrolase